MQHISDLTIQGDYLYFGAGYHLYRLNLYNPKIETIFTTDRIRVEQPLVVNGVVYAGGRQGADENGVYGKYSRFFAVALKDQQLQWEFPLGADGYGTYGTYPVIAGDHLLVSARQHLHCLDLDTGKEHWRVDNWMGRVSDGVVRPYVLDDSVYYMLGEDAVADSEKPGESDGHWAEVSLHSGRRLSMLRIAEHPGTWNYRSGSGNAALVDGVIYGATRIDHFGALDLKAGKILWEIQGNNFARPAVNDSHVFTTGENSIQALDRKTGFPVWSVPIGDIGRSGLSRANPREFDYEYYWSRRFALRKDVVVVQGSEAVAALQAKDGKLLWITNSPDDGNAEPVIWQRMVIATSQKRCSVFALDIQTGRELWRVGIPDCQYFYLGD